ncbi:MAG: amidohydrolase family protein [Caulobacter sp.]|nr:amidohydrolase family protein [Caulobacter sp.]
MSTETATPEAILEPDLPIIDPHHHLWDRPVVPPARPDGHPFEAVIRLTPRYLLDELRADAGSGHNVTATVYLQCGAFYRADAAPGMAPVGEVEFVNGVAAMSASGIYGPFRACDGIVGHADLLLGDGAAAVLEAEIAAGGGRFKGIRHVTARDADPAVLGPMSQTPAGLMAESAFRAGFARLTPMGLSFDAWLLEPQLPELIDLARAFPDTDIILDHVGTPLGIGTYAGRLEERFGVWRDNIRALAKSPKVTVKLGGLAMPFPGFPGLDGVARPSSQALADLWRPYVETCIEAFGPNRCMFESNFPVDRWGCDYATLWNAFKRIAAGASDAEKADLFSGTARRVYRLA